MWFTTEKGTTHASYRVKAYKLQWVWMRIESGKYTKDTNFITNFIYQFQISHWWWKISFNMVFIVINPKNRFNKFSINFYTWSGTSTYHHKFKIQLKFTAPIFGSPHSPRSTQKLKLLFSVSSETQIKAQKCCQQIRLNDVVDDESTRTIAQ